MGAATIEKTMFRARASLLVRSRLAQTKSFCSNTTKHNNSGEKIESNSSSYHEAYKQLDKLDFMTAAKMLFTDPPKKKKFGLRSIPRKVFTVHVMIVATLEFDFVSVAKMYAYMPLYCVRIDFHLVQLFFACLPSLAVYLVAQYSRYEMRRMEAELEQKKKEEEKKRQEEEEKANELELKEFEEKVKSNPELLEVKTRLGKLEEAVQEIVVESKKQSSDGIIKSLDASDEKKHDAKSAPGDTQSRTESSSSVEKDHLDKQKSGESTPGLDQGKLSASAPTNDGPYQDQMGKTRNGGSSEDAKR